MNTGRDFVKLGACCAMAVMVMGCATEEKRARASAGRTAAAYESELNREWAGKPYTALLAAYGEPKIVMNIPSSGLNAAVVVYPVLDKFPAKCTHAFTVHRGADPKVVKYECQ